MVNYFIYARDCSFSTLNNEHYHINGLKTLEQFKRDVENIKEEQVVSGQLPTESKVIYLQWGDECWEVDEEYTRTAYLERQCELMGSDPKCIIRYLQKNYIKDENDKVELLYIITDGLISNERAKRCFRWNAPTHYATFVFHAFNEDPQNVNLSVAASFFKSRCLVYRNYKLYASTDISKKFNYDKISAYNFAAERDRLKCYIMLKFMDEFRRDAYVIQEVDKLKQLRDRLFDELKLETVNFVKIEVNPEAKDRDGFLDKFVETDENNNLVRAMEAVKVNIEKSIAALINYAISDEISYSFENLKSTEEFDVSSVKKEEILDLNFTSKEFEMFDFTLEDNVEIAYENSRTLVNAT